MSQGPFIIISRYTRPTLYLTHNTNLDVVFTKDATASNWWFELTADNKSFYVYTIIQNRNYYITNNGDNENLVVSDINPRTFPISLYLQQHTGSFLNGSASTTSFVESQNYYLRSPVQTSTWIFRDNNSARISFDYENRTPAGSDTSPLYMFLLEMVSSQSKQIVTASSLDRLAIQDLVFDIKTFGDHITITGYREFISNDSTTTLSGVLFSAQGQKICKTEKCYDDTYRINITKNELFPNGNLYMSRKTISDVFTIFKISDKYFLFSSQFNVDFHTMKSMFCKFRKFISCNQRSTNQC